VSRPPFDSVPQQPPDGLVDRRVLAGQVVADAPSPLPGSYPQLLVDIKARIRQARTRAALSVDSELIGLYWEIGRAIVQRQRSEGWGTSVIDRLAADLRVAFPGLRGFSAWNILKMRSFYLAYSEQVRILEQPVPKLGTTGPPTQTTPIPWGHNILLIQRLKDPAERLRDLFLELGRGFSFAGSQYRIEVGGEDFYIDLLFYHLRHPQDEPSIGLILCRERNRIVAEYALQDIVRPLGVATYRLLPEEIRRQLPSLEELEEGLSREDVGE